MTSPYKIQNFFEIFEIFFFDLKRLQSYIGVINSSKSKKVLVKKGALLHM